MKVIKRLLLVTCYLLAGSVIFGGMTYLVRGQKVSKLHNVESQYAEGPELVGEKGIVYDCDKVYGISGMEVLRLNGRYVSATETTIPTWIRR